MKDIFLYGEIGSEIQPRNIAEQFQAAGAEDVRLRIHSGGGSVFDGLAILSAVRSHPGRVTARVDGVAMSMAANIALECAEIEAHEDGWLMFHEVRTSGGGMSAEDLAQRLRIVQAMNEQIVGRLVKATGADAEQVTELLAGEWYGTGAEWQAAGVVTSLLPAAALAAKFDPARYEALPAQLCLDCAALSAKIQDVSKVTDFFADLGWRRDETATPDEIECTVADLREKLREMETERRDLAAENELQTDALSFARGKIEQLTAQLEDLKANSHEVAYRRLAEAGHEAVRAAPSDQDSGVVSTYEQLSKEVEAGVPGAAKKRQAYRRQHRMALEAAKSQLKG